MEKSSLIKSNGFLAFTLLLLTSFSQMAWATEMDVAMGQQMALLQKIEDLQEEIKALRGEVEEQAHHLQHFRAQQKKLYLKVNQCLQERGLAALSGNFFEGTEQSVKGRLAAHVASEIMLDFGSYSQDTQQATYQQAYHLLQSKDLNKARQAFNHLIDRFPKGSLLPNAHYWLGEIYWTQGQFDLAAQAFDLVYHQYRQHPKAAGALLKLGYIAQAKAKWQQAKALLIQVKGEFQGTASAQLAEASLQKMYQQGYI